MYTEAPIPTLREIEVTGSAMHVDSLSRPYLLPYTGSGYYQQTDFGVTHCRWDRLKGCQLLILLIPIS